MTRTLHNQTRWLVALIAASVLAGSLSAVAQNPPRVHHFHHYLMPPGVIGQEQLRLHEGMAGYFQPVELTAPEGVEIAVMQNGVFDKPQPGPILIGMLIGQVYHLKLTKLPAREGAESFPTVELVNRLYPPEGKKIRFPVPIDLGADDIAQTQRGLFVTRVVYLEDPSQALPRADRPGLQRAIDVSAHEDPLHVADRLGRPMAIVRVGSRVPDAADLIAHSAPLQIYPAPAKATAQPIDPKAAIEQHGQDVPRVPLELPPPIPVFFPVQPVPR